MIESCMAAAPAMLDAFQTQVQWCHRLGAPFTARVVELLGEDWAAGGIVRALVPEWAGNPWDDAVALRLAGALHALVLGGQDEALARCYTDQRLDGEHDFALRRAVLGALRSHADRALQWLAHPPQTNEPGRSAALLGGYAHIAAHTALPLAIYEIGASAGLNLLWDRYRYRIDRPGSEPQAWGDATSPVLIECTWRGRAPALPPQVAVVARAGCDTTPIDLRDPAESLRLQSFTWPDQRVRQLRLRAAIDVAQREPPPLVSCGALDWLREAWADAPRPGAVTVLVHSLVWQYLGDAERQGVRALLEEVGARASVRAPLAWLRMEPYPSGGPELKLTLWPGGERRVLGEVHTHGASVDWH
jgi:hypothetical protein